MELAWNGKTNFVFAILIHIFLTCSFVLCLNRQLRSGIGMWKKIQGAGITKQMLLALEEQRKVILYTTGMVKPELGVAVAKGCVNCTMRDDLFTLNLE